MKKTLDSAFWTGAVLIGLIVFSASFIVWAAIEYTGETPLRDSKNIEVVHDTVKVEVIKEVIKEVEVPCTLPHVQPKPIEVKKEEPKLELPKVEPKIDTAR